MGRKGICKFPVTIFGIIKPLKQWAEEYDLPYKTVYERYRNGLSGEDLIKPEKADILTYPEAKHLWRGRWTYSNELAKSKQWIFRRKPITRWVYVGT